MIVMTSKVTVKVKDNDKSYCRGKKPLSLFLSLGSCPKHIILIQS